MPPTTLPTSEAFWTKALDLGIIGVCLLVAAVLFIPLIVWTVKVVVNRLFHKDDGLVTMFVRSQVELTRSVSQDVTKMSRAASRQAASSKATNLAMINIQETMKGMFAVLTAQHVAKEDWMLTFCDALDIMATNQKVDIKSHLDGIRSQIQKARETRAAFAQIPPG